MMYNSKAAEIMSVCDPITHPNIILTTVLQQTDVHKCENCPGTRKLIKYSQEKTFIWVQKYL